MVKFFRKGFIPKSNFCELYFAEQDIEAFVETLEWYYLSIQYVMKLIAHQCNTINYRFESEMILMFYEAFPKKINNDLQEVLKIIQKETYNTMSIGYSENVIDYYLNNVIIKIPYRMYFIDVDFLKIDNLTDIQKEILYCIYTRNSNGYIREKYLKELLNIDFDYWAIPFIVKLSDEYIIEILEVIYDKLKNRNNDDIKQFCLENKTIINKSYSRMISYWNEFYRSKEPNFHKYIGRKLFRECFGYNKSFER